MASLTLVESAKIQQNPLIQGIIESIVTVNTMYQFLPFDAIVGNALLYTRENAIGGVAPVGIGGGSNTIPAGAKTPATFTPVTTPLKALIGDALVDHFIEVTMSNDNDQRGVQVASKAKGLGREYQRQLILGDSAVDPLEFDGLDKLMPAAQTIAGGGAASATGYSFELLDELISSIKAKDGQVDFIMMPDVALRRHMTLLRALGGASISEVRTMPDGTEIMFYRGIPMFRNDWIPVSGTTTKICDIYAGTFDDGSRKTGIAALTSVVQNGIFVSYVGEAENTNDTITRLRMYASLAVFSELGVGKINDVRVFGPAV
jgi:hypothetical protein